MSDLKIDEVLLPIAQPTPAPGIGSASARNADSMTVSARTQNRYATGAYWCS